MGCSNRIRNQLSPRAASCRLQHVRASSDLLRYFAATPAHRMTIEEGHAQQHSSTYETIDRGQADGSRGPGRLTWALDLRASISYPVRGVHVRATGSSKEATTILGCVWCFVS
ncbi:hypothetical protein BRADI_1g19036v3 [Brachypodium distachyon]|uniref:Uncharacterized protein n=1 Tax=Brachypodium distachyon TaxID=15368 RepID=A0A2K2DK28_BRADI|nr:hypothetical protein BRADI_1g19036v3 [Brachypodium distachyon]